MERTNSAKTLSILNIMPIVVLLMPQVAVSLIETAYAIHFSSSQKETSSLLNFSNG
jgi:hypothetical protein